MTDTLSRNMMQSTTRDAAHFHAAKFYETSESLCEIAAEFLAAGLLAHQPALAIVTPAHRAGIVAGLRVRTVDIEAMQKAGDLLLLDVADTLATFMVDGKPDAALFLASITGAIEQLCQGRKDRGVRAYGELVDVLWKAGDDTAAIRVELLWNKLAMTHDFALLCGYSMGNFYKDTGVAAIAREHSHIVPPDQALPALPLRL
jgi:hypothetical protein